MLGLWRRVTSALFYLSLALALGGLAGNALVLWQLYRHVRRGPLGVYLLHLAAADALFLGCHLGFSLAQWALGAQHGLQLPICAAFFATALWLLAVLSLERCLSHLLPGCYGARRPAHTSGVLGGLAWALGPLSSLLPARACGLLGPSGGALTCLRYHSVAMAWLLALAAVACGSGLLLFLWVTCCSRRPRPRLYGAVLGSALLLLLCGLPYLLYWSLSGLLSLLLPVVPPLATLLACVHAAARPLLYFALGRRPGPREPLRAILKRALEEAEPATAGSLALPLGAM